MEFKEWDLFKFNNQLYVVDKCQDDKIYSKKIHIISMLFATNLLFRK